MNIAILMSSISQPTIVGTFQIMGIGDSLQQGYNADDRPNQNSLRKAYNKLQANFEDSFGGYQNFGTGGAGVAVIGDTQLTSAVAAKGAYDSFILFVQGGVNDLGGGNTAINIYNIIKQTHIDAVAEGFVTIACTIAAQDYEDYNPATTDPVRISLNTMIRNGVISQDIPASGIVDLGAHPYFGDWNSGDLNFTYIDIADRIHYTVEGHRYIGENLLYSEILSIARN